MQDGNDASAMAPLQLAEHGLPGSWPVLYYLAKAKSRMGDANGAIQLLQRATSLNADEASVYYLLGQNLSAVHRSEEAKAAFEKVRALRANALSKERKITESIPGVR